LFIWKGTRPSVTAPAQVARDSDFPLDQLRAIRRALAEALES
jgi:hypothetical protein